MTYIEFIKQCLWAQAIRTEPVNHSILKKVMKKIERLWKKEI